MSFHKRFATDTAAAENGTWIDFGDGLKIKARRPSSIHTQAVRKELQEEFAPLIKMGQEIPEKDQERLFTQLLSKSIIVDWQGVTVPDASDDTKEVAVPATPEEIYKLLSDPVYADFRTDIVNAVTSRDTFKAAVRKDDAKN